MVKCKNCQKEIPKGLDFCSKECAEQYNQKARREQLGENRKTDFLSQFDKGSGSFRREKNIEKVAETLRNGESEDEIRFRLSLSFKSSTVDDYLRTAKELLRRGKT